MAVGLIEALTPETILRQSGSWRISYHYNHIITLLEWNDMIYSFEMRRNWYITRLRRNAWLLTQYGQKTLLLHSRRWKRWSSKTKTSEFVATLPVLNSERLQKKEGNYRHIVA